VGNPRPTHRFREHNLSRYGYSQFIGTTSSAIGDQNDIQSEVVSLLSEKFKSAGHNKIVSAVDNMFTSLEMEGTQDVSERSSDLYERLSDGAMLSFLS
jgi:hypothetical protein